MVVSHHVGAENRTQVLWKRGLALPAEHLSSPIPRFLQISHSRLYFFLFLPLRLYFETWSESVALAGLELVVQASLELTELHLPLSP